MEQRIINNLKSLKALLDSGVLSAEEFEKEKRSILRGDSNKSISPISTNTNQKVEQTEEAKESVRSHIWSNGCLDEKVLLWWVVIYIIVGVVAEFIRNILNSNGLWYDSVIYRNIFFLLLIIRNFSNILPTLAIKNKTYKIPCVIGVGLLSLYYIYDTILNMMQY